METKIKWANRYSDTMENDKQGRWARIAYAGMFGNIGFYRGKVCRWEICWIKRIVVPISENNKKEKTLFTIHPEFPYNGKRNFEKLEDAKKEVEVMFRWFIKMCNKK